jgi:hypothetical protein
MDRIRAQTFLIAEENFQDASIAPRMDYRFAQACSVAAENGSIFIMRGVNPSSLGANGVLLSSDSRAPKPMTCHAKSSEFGFTKGLVPANPQFSCPAYVNKDGDKYKGAFKDVNKTLGRAEDCEDPITAGVKSTEGKALHLKMPINGQDCHVYQGIFQKNSITYRYQVAIPADNTNAIQQAVQARLGNPANLDSYLKVYKDPDPREDVPKWEEITDLSTISLSAEDFAQVEPTLVIGLKGQAGAAPGTGGSQHAAQDRYYVSDYDVYAIAHTARPTDPNQPPQSSWPNCGEFADPRDIEAIIDVNARLLGQGQDLETFKNNLGSHFRDFLIQHAAAAAGIVETKGTKLEGFAVPDFPVGGGVWERY